MMDGSEYIFGPNCIGWQPRGQYSVAFAPLVFFLDSFHFFFSEIIFDIEMLKKHIGTDNRCLIFMFIWPKNHKLGSKSADDPTLKITFLISSGDFPRICSATVMQA